MTTTQTEIPGESIVMILENLCLSRYGASISANGQASSSLSAENLSVDNVNSAWRSLPLESYLTINPILTIDLGKLRSIDWISFHMHNIRDVNYTVRIYNTVLPSSPSLTIGPLDPIIRASLDEFTWETLRWELGPPGRQLKMWQEKFSLSSFCALETKTDARIIQIEFNVDQYTSNYDVPYIQIGYLMVARSFRPLINALNGWQLKPIDRSNPIRDESGNIGGREQSKSIAIIFSLPNMKNAEAFEDLLLPVEENGLLGKVFVAMLPQKRRYFYQTSVLGTIQMPTITFTQNDLLEVNQFTIEGV